MSELVEKASRYFTQMSPYELSETHDILGLEMRERAYKAWYDEGYAQGKAEADAEFKYDPTEDITYWRKFKDNTEEQRKLGAINMQKQRDEIVERAKAGVAELKHSMGYTAAYPYNKYGRRFSEVFFAVNRKRGIVVAIIKPKFRHSGKEVLGRGIAKCAPNDCFNVHIGKAIALRRALGLEVPSEYLNAPQPTEVRVGDIITFPKHDNWHKRLNYRVDSTDTSQRNLTIVYDEITGGIGYKANADFTDENGVKLSIIDDSREGVTE